jgi:WD40 repeat protein
MLVSAMLALGEMASGAPITAIAFPPLGDVVVVGSQAGLQVYSWPGLIPQRRLATSMDQVHDLAFAPRGDVLAVVGGDPAEAGIFELVAWPSGELLHRGEPHEDSIYAVDWRPDSAAFATASLDRTVQVHSPAGERLSRLEGHSGGVLAVRYLPDGLTLVSGGLDQGVRVWEASTGRLLRRLDQHSGAVVGLAVRPEQPERALPMIASIGSDRTLRLWQPTIGRMVRQARLEGDPQAIAWTQTGRSLAVAHADGHVRMFDPETVAGVEDLPGADARPHCLVVAPDGRILLGGRFGLLIRGERDPGGERSSGE